MISTVGFDEEKRSPYQVELSVAWIVPYEFNYSLICQRCKLESQNKIPSNPALQRQNHHTPL